MLKIIVCGLTTSFIVLLAPLALAAFCSLRDPILAINTLYPDATAHRSIVRVVDQNARRFIAQQLPFTLHFNELGQHSLYVAMSGETPRGLVHARSEASSWGLIEIAWGIRPDLVLEDFFLQRCRDPLCRDAVFIDQLRSDLAGKDFDALLVLLDGESHAAINPDTPRDRKKDTLRSAILRSALKTLAVTESVWAQDLHHLQRLRALREAFPGRPSLTLVADNSTLEAFSDRAGQTMVDPASVSIFRVMDQQQELARLVQASWMQAGVGGVFLWFFSREGDVLRVSPMRSWPSAEIANNFTLMQGANVANKNQCNTSIDLAAHELYTRSWRGGSP